MLGGHLLAQHVEAAVTCCGGECAQISRMDSIELACELLQSKDTVTSTRLNCLCKLQQASRDGAAVADRQVTQAIVQAALANFSVGNIRVRREALVLVHIMAHSLGGAFLPFLEQSLPLVVERLGDNSITARIVSAAAADSFKALVAAVGATVCYEHLLRGRSFAHKNWHIRERLLRGLSEDLQTRASGLPLEALMKLALGALDDRAPEVRGAAMEALTQLYRRVGEPMRAELQRSNLRDAHVKQLEQRFAAVTVDDVTTPVFQGHIDHTDRRASTSTSTATSRRGTSGPSVSGGSEVSSGHTRPPPAVVGRRISTKPELMREINLAERCLRSAEAEDWDERVGTMRRLCDALLVSDGRQRENGALASFGDVLWCHPLRPILAEQLTDPRSAIVREVCSLLTAFSTVLADRFARSAEFFLPQLLKLCCVTVQLIRDSADRCICGLLSDVRAPKLLSHVASKGATSRHAVLRARSQHYIVLALGEWRAAHTHTHTHTHTPE